MRWIWVAAVLHLTIPLAIQGTQADWPREIETAEGTVTLYQPQLESFEGDALESRAAISVTPSGGAPVFGAVWISAKVETDRDERLVHVREVKVPQVKFADASDEKMQRLATFLEREIPKWDLTFALDRLLPDMQAGGPETAAGLRHDAPRILYSRKPTVLVTIDGDPKLQKIEEVRDADLKRVVNTPFVIVLDEGSGTYYLHAGGTTWYTGREIDGPWEATTAVPDSVAGLVPPDDDGEEPGEDADQAPPDVIVVTEPTELIVSAGDPSWAPIEGMSLLYMDNTDSDVFLEIESQSYFVVLSGRWYRGVAANDVWEWTHVANDELPGPFSDIPADSVNGSVRVYVAGAEEAREAVLDNSIPQTAAIRRDEAALEIEYDGKPQFEDVEEMSVQYAVNTPSSVFKVGSRYYACDQGVWYDSSSPTGPWKVSTEVPDVLYDIPPSNPHYNVTYVKVYDVTPEVVYVGYTPGYLGSYYYGGCVVYGTGWWYRPWYGSFYYPRPSTWGFHVRYNPWTGWGFGVSWSSGPFHFSFGTWGVGGWFGPAGYRPYRRPYVGVGFHKTEININRDVNIDRGDINIDRGSVDRDKIDRDSARNNLYDKNENRTRNSERERPENRQRPEATADRKNDVLTDRDGNVYRKDQNGSWQQREGNQWKDARDLDRSRESAGQAADRAQGSRDRQPGTSDRAGSGGSWSGNRGSGSSFSGGGATRPQLERDSSARQRGNQRTNDFQRSRGSAGGMRGGGSRGGGGRRR